MAFSTSLLFTFFYSVFIACMSLIHSYKYVQVFSVISKLSIYLKEDMALFSCFAIALLPFKPPFRFAGSSIQPSMPDSLALLLFSFSNTPWKPLSQKHLRPSDFSQPVSTAIFKT